MIFDILFLPIVLFIGLVTSYEDIKYGRVRNKWIRLGLVWGLVIIIFFFIWYFIASPVTHFYYSRIVDLPEGAPQPVFTVSLNYLLKVVLNAALALVIAFLMWRFDAWGAGDAKLFFVFSLLLPLKYYWKSYLSLFPSFVLLINIFIPVLLYLFFKSIIHYFKFIYLKIFRKSQLNQPVDKDKTRKETKEKKSFWKKIIQKMVKRLGVFGVFLLFILLQQPIDKYFSIDISSFQMFFFAGLIIFSGPLFKLLEKPLALKITIGLSIILLGYGFVTLPETTYQILAQTIKMMVIFIIVLSLFRKLIDFYVSGTGVKGIKIEELGPEMSLTEEVLNKLKEDKLYYDKHIGRIYPGGLNPAQAEAVKRWLRRNKKFKGQTIKIYKPFPFVVWIFLGLIITLILKQSLFHLFLNY
jgi:Flp pilus assembly protein protease CpaA